MQKMPFQSKSQKMIAAIANVVVYSSCFPQNMDSPQRRMEIFLQACLPLVFLDMSKHHKITSQNKPLGRLEVTRTTVMLSSISIRPHIGLPTNIYGFRYQILVSVLHWHDSKNGSKNLEDV